MRTLKKTFLSLLVASGLGINAAYAEGAAEAANPKTTNEMIKYMKQVMTPESMCKQQFENDAAQMKTCMASMSAIIDKCIGKQQGSDKEADAVALQQMGSDIGKCIGEEEMKTETPAS